MNMFWYTVLFRTLVLTFLSAITWKLVTTSIPHSITITQDGPLVTIPYDSFYNCTQLNGTWTCQ